MCDDETNVIVFFIFFFSERAALSDLKPQVSSVLCIKLPGCFFRYQEDVWEDKQDCGITFLIENQHREQTDGILDGRRKDNLQESE